MVATASPFVFICIFLVLGKSIQVLISTLILFMRTGIHCLTQDLFSLLFWIVLSLPLFSFFLYLSFSVVRSSIFSALQLFALTVIFLNSSFCFCFLRLLTISLFMYFLSNDFGCFLFAVPFSFILSLSFFLAFFLSLTFLFPHFSLSLSLSLSWVVY